MIDYPKQIDDALQSYENNKPYHVRNIDWICGRIDWCWKWKKITNAQKDDFANRAIAIMERNY